MKTHQNRFILIQSREKEAEKRAVCVGSGHARERRRMGAF